MPCLSLTNVTLLALVILFAALVIMDFYSSCYFRKRENDYKLLLSEYRQRGYDLNLMTNYASFFGSLANYQKIIWFVRLYNGVKMKFTKDRYVQDEAYQFIQSLPEERIGWILKLHRRYKLQAVIFALWIILGAMFLMLIK
ncbi:hypothetical protein CJP72_14260 [Citrobacter sp. NCU1]|uniref:hypothetical protein n=1 Tax=Citrobacter sp. NCU1 TaxID=2026683 RepID=UPI0013914A8B|nr:hypothetical protein [Citrobacter sp. NCU1]NDO81887.1 hypothetical protein [Citrobacter sp. NCU1]